MKLDLLTNATVVDDAIRFVSDRSITITGNVISYLYFTLSKQARKPRTFLLAILYLQVQ